MTFQLGRNFKRRLLSLGASALDLLERTKTTTLVHRTAISHVLRWPSIVLVLSTRPIFVTPSRTADRRFAIWVCGALAAIPRMWIPFAFCMKSPAFPVGTSVAELFAITFRLMGRTHELLQQAA